MEVILPYRDSCRFCRVRNTHNFSDLQENLCKIPNAKLGPALEGTCLSEGTEATFHQLFGISTSHQRLISNISLCCVISYAKIPSLPVTCYLSFLATLTFNILSFHNLYLNYKKSTRDQRRPLSWLALHSTVNRDKIMSFLKTDYSSENTMLS